MQDMKLGPDIPGYEIYLYTYNLILIDLDWRKEQKKEKTKYHMIDPYNIHYAPV